MKYPPPTVGKFRTVTELTVRKFRTLLLVNQGRVVWGCSWASAVWVTGGGTAAEGKECNAPKGSLGGHGQAADSCECQECEECGHHTWPQEAPSGQVLCSECFDSEMLEWRDRS
jgi:hypothetical protein